MASGYKFSLVRALSWCCVFFSGQWTFGFCLRELWNHRGFQHLACSVHTELFLCSAMYHFMFSICMNSCGGGKGSGQPRHFPGKWGTLCNTDTGKTQFWELKKMFHCTDEIGNELFDIFSFISTKGVMLPFLFFCLFVCQQDYQMHPHQLLKLYQWVIILK